MSETKAFILFGCLIVYFLGALNVSGIYMQVRWRCQEEPSRTSAAVGSLIWPIAIAFALVLYIKDGSTPALTDCSKNAQAQK